MSASFSESFSLTVGSDIVASIMDWVRSDMQESLTSMPRIGPVTARCFRDAGVDTTYALMGKFLSLKTEGCRPVEHCERFWIWINAATENNRIIARDKATICRCICLKADILMPGLYDESAYASIGGSSSQNGGSATKN